MGNADLRKFSLRSLIVAVLFIGSVATLIKNHSAWHVVSEQHKEHTALIGDNTRDMRVLANPSGNEVEIIDGETTEIVLVLKGHQDAVTSVAFSPDGSRLISVSRDSTGRIWNVRTGAEVSCLKGHKGSIEHVSISADGQYVITAGEDAVAIIWDMSSAPKIVLVGHTAGLYTARFSPDSNRVITASKDGSARIWDVRLGNELSVLLMNYGVVWDAVFVDDNSIRTFHQGQRVVEWHRRRPEYWWGMFWLPEFWMVILTGICLFLSIRSECRALKSKT